MVPVLLLNEQTSGRDRTGRLAVELRRGGGWLAFWLTVSIVSVGVYTVSLIVVERPASGYLTLWDGWVSAAAAFSPVSLMVLRARLGGPRRTVWLLLAAGATSYAVANLIYLLHDQNQTPIPNPGPNDIPYLLCYLTFVLAALLMWYKSAQNSRRSSYLDGAIAGLSLASVAAAMFFRPTVDVSGDALLVAVNLAYPSLDLLLIIALIAGLAPLRYQPNWSVATMTMAMSIMLAGDIIYITRIANGTYVAGSPLEASWAVGILLIGVSAWVPTTARRSRPVDESASTMALPAIFAVFALAILALAPFREMPTIASVLAVGAISLVLARVLFAVRELRHAATSHREARTDELTGLANRRAFLEQLDQRLGDGRPTAVLLIDLNGFKEVNDTLGHDVGDELLRMVARRIRPVLGGAGLLARLGGDEFGAFVDPVERPGRDLAEAVAASLHEAFDLSDMLIQISASTGVSLAPEHSRQRSELLRFADVAMYQAKRRQQPVTLYDPTDDPHSRDQLALVGDLQQAIAAGALIVHYQPLLDLRTGRLSGVEALARWQHPTRGLMMPDQFIWVAERAGIIPQLTKVMMSLAFRQVHTLERDHPDLGLSVNISGHDLLDERFPDVVRGLLTIHDFNPRRLTLEITETALVADPVRAETSIASLRRLGVRVAVDDFGVGYSSLTQLTGLTVDALKIDKSFIQSLDHDPRITAVVRATVELARALDLHVAAEGVETATALSIIRDLGCHTGQGNYIGLPMPLEDLREMLASQRDDRNNDAPLVATG